jgi:hypothetical protein
MSHVVDETYAVYSATVDEIAKIRKRYNFRNLSHGLVVAEHADAQTAADLALLVVAVDALRAENARMREAIGNREREHLEACAEADELRAEVDRLTQVDRERLDMLDLATANAGDAWAAVEAWQKKYAATEAGWRQLGVLIDFYRGAFDRVLPTDDELSAIEEAADFVRHQEAYWGSIMTWRDRVLATRQAEAAIDPRNPALTAARGEEGE